jgi:hypothetical protein
MINKKIIYYPFLLLPLLLLVQCGNKKIRQGILEFEINYPRYRASGFMANMLPDKMTMKFKNDKYVIEVKKGKAFSSGFIVDCKNKIMTSLYQFGTRRYYATLNEAETQKMLKDFPVPTYIHAKEGDSLAGFLCRKSIAVFEDLSQPDVTLYYTDEIGIKNANWCTPFSEIEDVLLVYEVERYGMRMRFTATKFIKEEIPDEVFDIPDNYKEVPLEKMEQEMSEMFKSFLE